MKLLEKLGILIYPKLQFLIHLILLVAHLLCHPKKVNKRSGSIFLKLLMTIKKLAQYPGHSQFIFSVNYYQYEEIIAYNDIIYHITNQENQSIYCM